MLSHRFVRALVLIRCLMSRESDMSCSLSRAGGCCGGLSAYIGRGPAENTRSSDHCVFERGMFHVVFPARCLALARTLTRGAREGNLIQVMLLGLLGWGVSFFVWLCYM